MLQASKTSIDLASKYEKSFQAEISLLNQFNLKLEEMQDVKDEMSLEHSKQVIDFIWNFQAH